MDKVIGCAGVIVGHVVVGASGCAGVVACRCELVDGECVISGEKAKLNCSTGLSMV